MPQCPNPHRSERRLLPWFGATAQFVGRLTKQAVISLGADGRYDLDAWLPRLFPAARPAVLQGRASAPGNAGPAQLTGSAHTRLRYDPTHA